MEQNDQLTIHDYTFLKGDPVYWPHWGASYSYVSTWVHNKGYGGFGDPTAAGLIAMDDYEFRNREEDQSEW
jgi:hypothetical protein